MNSGRKEPEDKDGSREGLPDETLTLVASGDNSASIGAAEEYAPRAIMRCLLCGWVGLSSVKQRCLRCSGTLAPVPSSDLVDGRYVIERRLGKGGAGAVELAMDVFLNRQAALKFLDSFQRHPRALDALQLEAMALAGVKHENVVQVYTCGPHKEAWYIALEYIAGQSLSDIIVEHAERGAFLPLQRVISIVKHIARGLEAVHQAGLIHRDVKPSNIVVETRTGRPVLIDFGLAHVANAKLSGKIVGTPLYMAPEQIVAGAEFGPISPATDIYALGVVMFEMLANQPLWTSTQSVQDMLSAHVYQTPPDVGILRPAVAAYAPIIKKALAKQPKERFSTCRELVEALQDVERMASTQVPEVSSNRPVQTQPNASEGVVREIMIVDDDEIFRKIAGRAAQIALFRHSMRVRVAEGGPAALRHCRETMPHLLILDYSMPGMNGVDVLAKIRDLPGGHQVYVVVVSANLMDNERWKFGILGVVDFIQKPVGLNVLVELFRELSLGKGWVNGDRAVKEELNAAIPR